MTEATGKWSFEDPPETAVVTTTQITQKGAPILYVSHERDENGEATWQFHSLIEPFSMDDAQLVRLETIVRLDPTIAEIADLPMGYAATRMERGGSWRRHQEQPI